MRLETMTPETMTPDIFTLNFLRAVPPFHTFHTFHTFQLEGHPRLVQ